MNNKTILLNSAFVSEKRLFFINYSPLLYNASDSIYKLCCSFKIRVYLLLRDNFLFHFGSKMKDIIICYFTQIKIHKLKHYVRSSVLSHSIILLHHYIIISTSKFKIPRRLRAAKTSLKKWLLDLWNLSAIIPTRSLCFM